jgi:hypothetical protein
MRLAVLYLTSRITYASAVHLSADFPQHDHGVAGGIKCRGNTCVGLPHHTRPAERSVAPGKRVGADPSSTISVTASPATMLVALGVRLAPSVISWTLPLPGSISKAAPSVM